MAHLDMHRTCSLTILLSMPVALKNSFRSPGSEGSRLQDTRREGGGSRMEGEKECSRRGIAQAHTHTHTMQIIALGLLLVALHRNYGKGK